MNHPPTGALHRRLAAAIAAIVICAIGHIAPAHAADAAKGTPEHIRAATARIDGASIQANAITTKDWPS